MSCLLPLGYYTMKNLKYESIPYVRFGVSLGDEEPVVRYESKMRISFSKFTSYCLPLLAVVVFILQLIAFFTSHWAEYSAITSSGRSEEIGHYGLFTTCFTKSFRKVEDCDPIATSFRRPPLLLVTAILSFIHVFLVIAFIILGLIGILHVFKNDNNICIKRRILCLMETFLAQISTLTAVLATIFSCMNENTHSQYLVVKGWTFWIQVALTTLDLFMFVISATECLRVWQFQRQQQIDPEGKRAETYGNPTFDADSPELPRSQSSKNGTNKDITFTETSGHPYDENEIGQAAAAKNGGENGAKNAVPTLAYENECYLESSPKPARNKY